MKYYRIGFAFTILLGMIGCQQDQDVEPVISPDDYPVATVTSDFSGTTVTEGDTLNFTITLDKMLDRALTFTPVFLDSSASDELDIAFEPAVIQPYSKETVLSVVVLDDYVPEVSENLMFEITQENLADKYLVNPSTVRPVYDLTAVNHNDTSVLTIAYGWPNPDDDIDAYAFAIIEGDTSDWGYAASSDNPEILTTIWPSDPYGTYVLAVDLYTVTGLTSDYTISIGYPDQSVEFITGSIDMGSLDSYSWFYYSPWEYSFLHLLNIVNDGGDFTITHLNE